MGKRFHDTDSIILHPYSLVEMLVVMAIIAILIGVGAGGYTVAKKWQAKSRTEAILAKLKVALEAYKNDKGYYPYSTDSPVNFSIDVNTKDYTGTIPSSNDHLQIRNNMSKFIDFGKIQQDQSIKVDEGSYYRYFVKDGWNTPVESAGSPFSADMPGGPIKYRCPGLINKTSFDLYSAGPDRKFASNPAENMEDDIYCKL